MAKKITILAIIALFTCKIDTKQIIVRDVHHIHAVPMVKLLYPTTNQEMQDIVALANSKGNSISIAGRKHTQGGHTLYQNGICVDLTNFNKIISVDTEKQLATVQPGATWKDLQEVIKPMGLAVRCMQYFNRFTIGGSLSVNCNSHDTQASLLIDSVESIKILMADGTIRIADRTQNYDLFRCAIGGYGLFGIIIEATLRLTKDSSFIRKLKVMPTEKYLAYFQDNIRNNRHVSFHFTRLNTAKKDLFEKALVTTCYEPHDHKRSFGVPAAVYNATTNPLEFELVRQFDLFKDAHFFIESHLVPKHWRMTRNEVMTLTGDDLPLHGTSHVNMLEEYFVPVEQLNIFLDRLKTILKDRKVNLVYFLIRYLPQNNESFLSYAQKDTMSIVMFITHKRNDKGYAKHIQTSRMIIDLVHELGGTYYLVVHGHATHEQLKTSYPMISDFFAKKNEYDPKGIFKNVWYEQYKA